VSYQNDNIKDVRNIVEDALIKSRLLKEGTIRGSWKKIIGEDFAKYCFVLSVKDNILYIGVENSVWVHHLNMKKSYIIDKVNELLGINYIQDLIIRTAVQRKIEEEYTEEKDDGIDLNKMPLVEREYQEAEQISNEIDDLNIKEHIKKLMIYSKQKEKYLKLKGYKKCSVCGTLYDGTGNICINCKNNHKQELKKKIYKIIRNYPYVSFEEINKTKEYREIRKEEFLDIKSKLKDEYSKKMMRAINNDKVEEYKKNARMFFKLETGERSPNEIEKLVLNYLKWL
jgi:hypothetical protein